MNRLTVNLDRVAAFVVGVALAAVGLIGIDWATTQRLTGPEPTSTDRIIELSQTAWWPWALGVTGILLVLLGLRWLWAHLRSPRVAQLGLAGSDASGRLRADTKAATAAAADALAHQPGIRAARGQLIRDRGELVVELHAELAADVDLAEVTRSCEHTAAEIAGMLRQRRLHCRVHLIVATTPARVH